MTPRQKSRLNNININRRACGMPILNIKIRKCMYCGNRFETYGNSYTCCKSATKQYQDEYVYHEAINM